MNAQLLLVSLSSLPWKEKNSLSLKMTQAMLNQSNKIEVEVPILEAKLFEGILENKENRLFSTAPQLPEAIVGPYYTMRAAGKGTWQFLRYRRADNKEPLLVVTAPFDLYCGPIDRKSVV